jgi:hypothetical protein
VRRAGVAAVRQTVAVDEEDRLYAAAGRLDLRANETKIRTAVRRVADDALPFCIGGRIVMRMFGRMAIGACRNIAVPGTDLAGSLIGMTLLTLDVEVLVSAGFDHVGRYRLVAEGALSVGCLGRGRIAAVLRRIFLTTRCEKQRHEEQPSWCSQHASMRIDRAALFHFA